MRTDAIVYGIDSCDQVRKARAWLRAHGVTVRFHDFRADGLDEALLARWMAHLPWDALLNRRGLTWRQLDAPRACLLEPARELRKRIGSELGGLDHSSSSTSSGSLLAMA